MGNQSTENNASNVPAATERHRLVSQLLFGDQPPDADAVVRPLSAIPHTVPSKNDNSIPVSSSSSPVVVQNNGGNESSTNDANSANTSILGEKQLDSILSFIEHQIPSDKESLHNTSLFKNTLQLLHYQRDNYLVGTEYANWRQKDRQRQEKYYQSSASSVTGVPSSVASSPPSFFRRNSIMNLSTTPMKVRNGANSYLDYDIPYDASVYSHGHLSRIACPFLPSKTVQNALTPLVIGLIQKEDGALYSPIRNITIDVITSQQMNLQQTIKNQFLQYLDNPKNREAMKYSTQRLIINSTRQ